MIERHKNIKYSPSIEKDLKDLVEEYKRTNYLFNVFTLDNEDVDNNFDLTILHTFLNCMFYRISNEKINDSNICFISSKN